MSEKKLDRRDLLKKGGALGAGAVAAGALGGPAGAARNRVAKDSATPVRGGKITWAMEQDPGHIAPFGAILSVGWQAIELMY
jgi:hypothetical protein